ncbi:CU044_5270 family protein [Micromonospora sp. NPDC049523]|uniref:CU044_5270 family protein n=1 Tax=Micromonospora sp. NPDC049523 TaxID=3155921 RepID=UPI00342C7968
MNELDLMSGFRADLASAEPDALARARTRLLAEATAPAGRVRPVARWGWRLAPAVGLALAVVVGLVAVNLGTPRPDVTGPSTTTLDARTVLELAAAKARETPSVTPRPDQFVYVESVIVLSGGYVPPVRKHRQLWMPVDGTRDGWLDERSEDPGNQGRPDLHGPLLTLCPEQGPDCLRPAYVPGLPTKTDEMRQYLVANSSGEHPQDQRVFELFCEIVQGQYLPAPVLAALFEAVATLPGVVVIPDAVDAAGRHGVGVARTTDGLGSALIFDPTTHEYLGSQDVKVVPTGPATTTAGPTPGPPTLVPNERGWAEARTRIAIVDRVRQVP